MRAAKAAKDIRSLAGQLGQDLGQRLAEQLSDRAATPVDVAFFSEKALPLLLRVAGALCTEQPEELNGFLLQWFAEQLSLPAQLLARLREAGQACERNPNSASAPADALVRAPAGKPSPQRPVRNSSKVALPLNPEDLVAAGVPSAASAPAEEIFGARASEEGIRKDEPRGVVPAVGQAHKPRESILGTRRFSLQPLSAKHLAHLGSAADRPPEKPPQDEIISVLRRAPLLSHLPQKDLTRVAEITKANRFEAEASITTCGAPEECMHVIVQGSCSVSVPHIIGTMVKGDRLGEEALTMPSSVSQRQVVALHGGVTTLSVARADFEALDVVKGIGKRQRKVAAQGSIEEAIVSRPEDDDGTLKGIERCQTSGFKLDPAYQISEHDKLMIVRAVQNNKVLGDVMSLTEEQCQMFVDAVYLVTVESGTRVTKRGEISAVFFIVQEGCLELTCDTVSPMQFRHGDTFGELALLYDEPTKFDITAQIDSKLWVMPQNAFSKIVQISAKRRLNEFANFLRQVPLFQNIMDDSLYPMLASMVEEAVFVEGDHLCIKGEDEGLFFLIYEGSAVSQEAEGKNDERELGKGDWVGEDQLANNVPAAETLQVTTESACVLVLDYDSFRLVMDATERLLGKESHNDRDQSDFFRSSVNKVIHKIRTCARLGQLVDDRSSDLENLSGCEIVGALGEGSFGRVVLLRSAATQKDYALKAMSKQHLRDEKQEAMVDNERRLLSMVKSDFVVRLHGAYEDDSMIYLVLDAIFGGELFDVYTEHNKWGDVDWARFYLANITMGLRHLHSKRIVWRDLKLENCLVDSRGYLKLTDLGIAKMVIGKTYTVCGTVDYFAPETLRQLGHNRGADWWACGVLLFIIINGRSPFDAPEVPLIYKNIIKGIMKVEFPKSCPPEVRDVIVGLCKKKPEDRLTMQKGGVKNLMKMEFFSSQPWPDIEHRRIAAPYQPPAVDYEKIQQRQLSTEVTIDWDGLLPIVDDEAARGVLRAMKTEIDPDITGKGPLDLQDGGLLDERDEWVSEPTPH